MTLAAPVLRTQGSSTADQTTYSTASVTPPAGALVLVFVESGYRPAAAVGPATVSHPGIGQLVRVLADVSPNTNIHGSMWVGVADGSAGAVSISHAVAAENCAWYVVSLTSDVATPEIRQTAFNVVGATGTQGATLSETPLATSCVLGFVAFNSGAASIAVGSGFTQLGVTQNISAPAAQAFLEYDNSSASAYVSMVFGGSGGKVLLAVEIIEGEPPPVEETGHDTYIWVADTEIAVILTRWDGVNEVPIILEGGT